ncbi:hypothetical protein [Phaeobacter sp. HF9A]|uniref:hypothetical protein n=1 Tax=Phaeobacter sp. HF9A TaxID=2721561 RepID=UPI00142FB9E6|nr:hypothetical protein [Phaeobacter sp. HF9A]NIZ15195.1 hypothetical protein [Phaeobacter sp. HF9A]
MASIPLLSILKEFKSKGPSDIAADKKLLKEIAQIEKGLEKPSEDISKNIKTLLKGLNDAKKTKKADKAAVKTIEKVEKAIVDDEKKRLSLGRIKMSKPS